ncbi:MAG: DUF4388 domain-containing protein [Planctomycetota bacterium]
MSFYGDLKSIHLADLLQNFEAHALTGTLSIRSSAGVTAHLYLKHGRLALLNQPGRASVPDMLVARGVLPAEKVAAARGKRKGTKKLIVDVLQQMGLIDQEPLRHIAQLALTEDICDLVATCEGQFKFSEGQIPPRIFDAEERRLELAIPVGPLLLEAARRADEWGRIRQEVPSDGVYFTAMPSAQAPADAEDPELAAQILACLDGTLNARDVVSRFGHRRFEAYRALAELVRCRLVRAAEAHDQAKIAAQVAERDPRRALDMIRSSLEVNPHQEGLLNTQVTLAEKVGERGLAVDALKLLVQLRLEAGDSSAAREHLETARNLAPRDTSLWERSFVLAMDEKRREDALADGLALVELYREPGLHEKAKQVLGRLLKGNPRVVQIWREYAQSLVDCGNVNEAQRVLGKGGKAFLGRKEYSKARECFQALLEIDPQNEEALRSVESIDSNRFTERREWRRRFSRHVLTGTAAAIMILVSLLDVRARMDLASVQTYVSENELIEKQQYRRALGEYYRVLDRHPLTPTAHLDLQTAIDSLESKALRQELQARTERNQRR